MRINAVKLRIATIEGDFGFVVPFGPNLTIIRGNNSSGKSTLFLSLLYGLGMEELAGGKNEAVLPYATKEYFSYEGRRVDVIASEVFVEVENLKGEILTFRRAIRDEKRSSKLIEVLDGPYLTGTLASQRIRATYLHDAGGAQKAEGFHYLLENFLGYKLPSVPTTSGGETKLYLQAIFAAVAVEQKRGWTDYIANIPFFGIRDARTRVVEFLLALDVFETNSARNRLNADSVEIGAGWDSACRRLQALAQDNGISIVGLPQRVTVLFSPDTVFLQKIDAGEPLALPVYISRQKKLHEKLAADRGIPAGEEKSSVQSVFEKAKLELFRLANLYETASATLAYQLASVREYEQLQNEATAELAQNRTALKLRKLGAEFQKIEVAVGQCPTCHQAVEDSLLIGLVEGPQMDLETNIAYLEKQVRMLERQIAGGKEQIRDNEVLVRELNRKIDETRDWITALRSDVATDVAESRANVRRQIQIELEIEALQRAEFEIAKILETLSGLADKLRLNQGERAKMPKEYYSDEDRRKIRVFEQLFRANAGAFEYESAAISDIRINDETLIPFLENIELRQIRQIKTDIKADSSASDFVRLILSYLLALQQASVLPGGGGRHPGVLMLDEPGQHSMAQSSQRALLQQLAASSTLQGIVAASFDESPEVFREVTRGIEFDLIELGTKSIQPLR